MANLLIVLSLFLALHIEVVKALFPIHPRVYIVRGIQNYALEIIYNVRLKSKA